MTKRRLKLGWKSVAVVAFLVAATVGTEILAHRAVAEAWSQAATQKSEPYTALSYINTGKLPTYAPAGTPKRLTFRLSNHEASTTSYRYRAILSTGSTVTVLREAVVTLVDGVSSDQTFTFTLPEPDMDATIIVQLVDRAEYITFGTKS